MLTDLKRHFALLLGTYPQRDGVWVFRLKRHTGNSELANACGVDADNPLLRIKRVIRKRHFLSAPFRVPAHPPESRLILPCLGRNYIRLHRRRHGPDFAQTCRRSVFRTEPFAELALELAPKIRCKPVFHIHREPVSDKGAFVVYLPRHHGGIVAIGKTGVGIYVIEDFADKLLLVEDERGIVIVETFVLLHGLPEILESVPGRPRGMEVHIDGDAVLLQLEEQPVESVEKPRIDAFRVVAVGAQQPCVLGQNANSIHAPSRNTLCHRWRVSLFGERRRTVQIDAEEMSHAARGVHKVSAFSREKSSRSSWLMLPRHIPNVRQIRALHRIRENARSGAFFVRKREHSRDSSRG